jgi:hypothetical protein
LLAEICIVNVRTALSELPPVQHKDIVTFPSPATNADIITTLHRYWAEAVRQTKQLSERFRDRTVRATASRIWHFLKENVNYIPDGEDEQWIRLPNVLFSTQSGDCKSFALMANAILHNLGHTAVFRYVSFDRGNPIPTHVYSITKDEAHRTVIIDPVYDRFDEEKPYAHKKDVKMQVGVMTGLGMDARFSKLERDAIAWLNSRDYVSGIGKVTFKKIALSIPRNSYLGLVSLNAFKIATKLKEANTKNPSAVKNVWEKLGGTYSKLVSAINSGASKNPILGIGAGISLTALLASAAAIIGAVGSTIKSILGSSKETDDISKAAKAAGGVLDLVTSVVSPEIAESNNVVPGMVTWAFIEHNGFPARDKKYIKIINTGKILSVPDSIRSQLTFSSGGKVVAQWLVDAGYIKTDVQLLTVDGSQVIVTDPEPGSASGSSSGSVSSLLPIVAGGFVVAKIFSII